MPSSKYSKSYSVFTIIGGIRVFLVSQTPDKVFNREQGFTSFIFLQIPVKNHQKDLSLKEDFSELKKNCPNRCEENLRLPMCDTLKQKNRLRRNVF